MIPQRLASVCNAVVMTALAGWLFLAPAALLVRDLRDPALGGPGIPAAAWRMHRRVSEQVARWAPERVRSGRAAVLNMHNVAGTEWPVFSCVFYLWATEALQAEAQRNPGIVAELPAQSARAAIEAAAELLTDPNHAQWVRRHWGDDYLRRENLFYRMLLIAGLTSYEKLTGDRRHRALLAGQAESLAEELDRSPHGLLDDYPGQCYPIDVLPAVAAIRRADAVLGTDHSTFAARAVRGFEGARLDPKTGLPAYIADSRSGEGIGPTRGVGIAYELIWAPELWPEKAREWHAAYERHFLREGGWIAGVREFAAGSGAGDWSVEVDAGPVLAGYGTAASAFGIGAARANGRFRTARALAAEALAASWPLADGTLLGARLLSSLSDAPHVGEAILLFVLTRPTVGATTAETGGGGLPKAVWLAVGGYGITGFALIWGSVAAVRRWARTPEQPPWPWWLWLGLSLAGAATAWWANLGVGLALLLMAQLLPRRPGSRASAP